MNKRKVSLFLVLVLSASPGVAQYLSGSDGTYGPIDVTSGTVTLSMPVDGVFHATTIDVAAGATLTFDKNVANTPVYLLATGDVTIAGIVHVNGQPGTTGIDRAGGVGGPGGFDGGNAQFALPDGAGLGPGGAPECNHAGYASSRIYGTQLLMPPTGGSGGGGCGDTGGGGGGGGILIASTTSITIPSGGSVNSLGAGPTYLGSGGAIRLVAPIVSGTGKLDTRVSSSIYQGRVRVDAIDGDQIGFSIEGAFTRGTHMKSFPDVSPRLDIIEIAGNSVALDSAPVAFELPFGSSTTQDVVIRGEDFTGIVPIRLVITPDSGVLTAYDADIDMGTGNPAQVTISVTLQENITYRLNAWTRDM